MIIQTKIEGEAEKVREIFDALVRCGGLTGVKAGKTIIHFDHEGNFTRIQLDYIPWVKRK